VPANAPSLAAVITCATCAAKNHIIDHSEITAAQHRTKQVAIDKSWRERTPAFFTTHDLIDNQETLQRIHLASKARAPLMVYGLNAQKRSAIMWRYLAALGNSGVISPRTGGGTETDTLALATTADFKLIDTIKRDYLKNSYNAVYIDGIGEGRFLNTARRHEEYSALSSKMLAHNQIPVFTANFWSPDNPKANPFKTPDLINWVGVRAATDFATIYEKQPFLPIEVA
jgi:hypothetical protein